MKKPLMLISAAVLMAMTLPMAAQAEMVQAKLMDDGYRKVKLFVFNEMQTPNCMIKKGAALKYFSNGSMTFQGDIQCKQALDGDEFEVEFDFLTSNGQKLFDKELERHEVNEHVNQWFNMKEGFHSNRFRANKWDETTQIKLHGEMDVY